MSTVTDVGGPVTVNALKRGQVDAADLFTTDPAIEANDFVVLEDPKSNFAAQNIVPIINKDKASDGVKEVLNKISEELDTETLGELIGKVANDKEKPEDVAKQWLADEDLDRLLGQALRPHLVHSRAHGGRDPSSVRPR